MTRTGTRKPTTASHFVQGAPAHLAVVLGIVYLLDSYRKGRVATGARNVSPSCSKSTHTGGGTVREATESVCKIHAELRRYVVACKGPVG